jgi:hypothetical protein
MTNQAQNRDFKSLLLLATGPKALSWPVVFTGTALSVVIHFAPSGGTVTGSFWIRLVMAVCGYLPALGFVALIQFLTRNLKRDALRMSIVFFSYLFGGALRGVFFSLVFFSLGMSPSLNLGFRIAGSAIPFGFATALATVSVSALSESRDRIRSLVAKQAELITALAELSKARKGFEDRVSREVEARVETEISRLAGKPEKAILEDLKALVGEFVRPLSHRLASEVPDSQPAEIVEVRARWRETLRKISFELALRPLILPLAGVVTASPSFFFFFGAPRAMVMLLICYLTLSSMVLAFRWLARVLRIEAPLLPRAVFITVVFALIGMPAGALSDFYSQDLANPHFGFQAGLIVLPTLGWLILLGGAANAQSRELESQLDETVTELSWLRARNNLLNWFDRGELSRLLHGEVQSVLHFGIIRYESGSSKANRQKTLDEMTKQIGEAFTKNATPINLQTLVADHIDFWSDTCSISFNASAEAERALGADEIGRSIIWDVIKEACANAIRHGKASAIKIELTKAAPKLVTVKVLNNGNRPAKKASQGLGTSILDACATTWHLRTSGGQVALTAKIPVDGQN